MSVKSSLRAAVQSIESDIQLARRGAIPGWYFWTHYKGRVASRTGRAVGVAATRIRANGSKVSLFVTPLHLGALRGVFIDEEYDLSSVLSSPPTTILDLGANVGMATAYLHAHYPAAKFICVEPDPRNLPLLERTILANGIDAQIVRAAVASEPGILKLRIGDNPTCSALETSPMHSLNNAVDVQVTTVKQLLADAGWDQVDLVKIDIEGSEKELLSQNNEWLGLVGSMALEIHPNTSQYEIDSFVKPFGFELRRLGHGREPVYTATRP